MRVEIYCVSKGIIFTQRTPRELAITSLSLSLSLSVSLSFYLPVPSVCLSDCLSLLLARSLTLSFIYLFDLLLISFIPSFLFLLSLPLTSVVFFSFFFSFCFCLSCLSTAVFLSGFDCPCFCVCLSLSYCSWYNMYTLPLHVLSLPMTSHTQNTRKETAALTALVSSVSYVHSSPCSLHTKSDNWPDRRAAVSLCFHPCPQVQQGLLTSSWSPCPLGQREEAVGITGKSIGGQYN